MNPPDHSATLRSTLHFCAISLGIYYWAVRSTMSREHVQTAVEELETEAASRAPGRMTCAREAA